MILHTKKGSKTPMKRKDIWEDEDVGIFLKYCTENPRLRFYHTLAYETSARPMLSPSATPDISSLPPPSSQIETSPQTTTTTPVPTTPLSPTSSDPDLQRFDEILTNCQNTLARAAPGINSPEQLLGNFPSGASDSDLDTIGQCNRTIWQAINKYCNIFETYDAAKCSYVNTDEVKNFLDISAVLSQMSEMSIFR